MSGSKNALTKPKLEALIEALKEVDAGFQWSGFGALDESEEDAAASEAALSDEDAEGDEFNDADAEGYDREEIEVGIDAFLSELSAAKVIRKNKKGHLPSFSGVFELLFGEDQELVAAAREFEEFIEGYFGFVSYESMCSARESFRQIKRTLQTKATI